MTRYTYSIADDTLNGEVDNSALLSQVQTNLTITIAVDNIGTEGDELYLDFRAELSSGEITALDSVISLHNGEPLANTVGQPVSIVSGLKIDPYTDKLITSDQRFNGPLYVPACNFMTGYGSEHASWKPPQSNATNNFWSIDVSTSGFTKVTFTPSYAYQADGLGYIVHGDVLGDAFIYKVILNPHIPSAYGGSYVFAEGKRLITNGKFERYTDPKYIPKEATIPGVGVVATNVLQFIMSHQTDEHISMEVFASVYPQ